MSVRSSFIPEKTVINFVNAHIREFDKSIESLKELGDGVILFYLLKSLKQRDGNQFSEFKKLDEKRAHLDIVKRNNVEVMIRYLQTEENIPMHGISAIDIIRGNEKVILSVVWRVIMKFMVNPQQLDGLSVSDINKSRRRRKRKVEDISKETHEKHEGEQKQLHPYDSLICWVNEVLSSNEESIKHVIKKQEDWKSGIAFFYLVKSIDPQLTNEIPLNQSTSPRDLISKLIEYSSEKLDIPQIIDEQKFLDPVDKMSLLTYISFFKLFHLKNEEIQF